MIAIRGILEEHTNKLEECKQFCYNLTSGDSTVLLFNDEQFPRINMCTSFIELFTILRNHWSWQDYSLLKGIIMICNSKEAEEELCKFERMMGAYCGMKLISDTYQPHQLPLKYFRLWSLVDKPYKSLCLQNFNELQTFIFEYLDVQKYFALPFIKFLFS